MPTTLGEQLLSNSVQVDRWSCFYASMYVVLVCKGQDPMTTLRRAAVRRMGPYETHGDVKYVCDLPYRLPLVVELDGSHSLKSEEYATTIVAWQV